ncbi:MAG: t26-2p [Thermococcus sp.]|uniref:t26-2p n=1 Tax=Thermococcus sp. TaxID=35749 RepID=UPI001DCB42CD|nr:t26-2p [Thermococcus sp.]MBO8175181.1 t26-2p [Thermococcus sp.]
MASRIGKSGIAFTRGFYIDDEIELMVLALAKAKKSNASQVVRESIVEMFKKEFGTINVRKIAKELGLL